ncbi:hypothetical protein [Maribacter sp. 2307UL18-2]|uniref:hypothetical protein n=1 Tax=Maribacter sp. 2307UL18-2 TaxID=3386274 RepID=UPI0039BD73B1
MKLVLLPLLTILILGCQMNTSSSKDGSKGIMVSENGLSASRVYLADAEEETDNRTFFYGQKIYTNFIDIDGFIEENGKIFPQMDMFVLSKKGDTVLKRYDLFGADFEGLDGDDSSLNGHMILARPIYSGTTYALACHIRDTKGNASMNTKMDFELVPDTKIKVVSNGLTYSEAYIYSDDRDEIIHDGTFNFFENLRFDIQDLDGYVKKDQAIHLGMSVRVIDNDNNQILDMADVFEEPITNEALLKQGVAATLIVKEGQIANPLKWQIRIWDKNSEAKLKAEAKINVKN